VSKLLLGVSAPEHSTHARNAIRYLVERLNARHSNIEQLVIDAAATVLRVSSHEFEIYIEPHKTLPLLNINSVELKQKIRAALCSQNPYFLIDSLNQCIHKAKNHSIDHLFNGNIISGITTNVEADYIRSHQGLMLHIVHANSLAESAVLQMGQDLVVYLHNNEPLQEPTLQAYAMAIADRFEPACAAQTPVASNLYALPPVNCHPVKTAAENNQEREEILAIMDQWGLTG
jgi:hypothetical protein